MIQRAALGAVLAAPLLPAQTFIVDDDGGPGVHFTEISAALAAVPSGAVLRVRAGGYQGFTVTNQSVSIIGDDKATVVVAGKSTIGPTGATDSVLMTDMTLAASGLFGPWISQEMQGAQGSVTLARIDTDHYLIENCDDVHIYDLTTSGGHQLAGGPRQSVNIKSSVVEIVDSNLQGMDWTGHLTSPVNGGHGIAVRFDSQVVLVGSTVLGGGPGCNCTVPVTTWGVPGKGAYVTTDSRLLVLDGFLSGQFAIQAVSGGFARSEGAALQGGPAGAVSNNPSSFPATGSLTGSHTIGGQITFSIRARGGSIAAIHLGTQTQHLPLAPWAIGSLTIVPIVSSLLGTIPPGAQLDIPATIPVGWPLDAPLYAQFNVLELDGTTAWASNSMLLLVKSP